MPVTLHHGDCRDVLAKLPAESVHCCVTSPPYWGLRDYGVAGQIGLEPTLAEYVAAMVDVFRAVRRVLRNDGTLWLNLGDSYASMPNGRSAADTKAIGNDDRTFRDKPFSTIGPIVRPGNPDKNGGNSNRDGLAGFDVGHLKPKDICGIPWRVAFALQADGWWLRQDIIWSKPNPMPESVGDRCTKAHEYVFLLSKSARYYYDAAAIGEPVARLWDETNGGSWAHKERFPAGSAQGEHSGGYPLPRADGLRNKRSVWEVATAPFSGAHFATFPPALIEPCVLAGCPVGGTVLDPFGGAGTTGLVADRLQRNAVLIELNPAYAAMAERRITNDAPLFAEVAFA